MRAAPTVLGSCSSLRSNVGSPEYSTPGRSGAPATAASPEDSRPQYNLLRRTFVHRRTALREGVNSCKRWLAGVDGIILGLSPAKAGSPELATTFLFSSPGTAPSPEQSTQLSRCTKSAKKPKQRFPVASVFPTNINIWLCRLTRNVPLRLRLVSLLAKPKQLSFVLGACHHM